MTNTRYNPFFAIPSLEVVINQLRSESAAAARRWTPAVDIRETENSLVVKADLPEVDEKAIDIQIENGTLTLKGERKFETDENGTSNYHHIERSHGTFCRSFSLPDTIDAEKVAAEFKNGVLTITLPKKEAAKPRTIKVAVQ